jgi:DNA-binding protein YbaB
VRSVRIDPQVVDPEDVETLQDLVVGALQDAARVAQELQAEKMGPLAGGLGGAAGGLGLPGLDA